MPDETIVYNINELDINMIAPSTEKMDDADQGGSKIAIIGKPGTGKTTLIDSILYEKKHIFPVAMIMSGTEDCNGHYAKRFPSCMIYDDYNEEAQKKFVQRQKMAKKYLDNPWAVCIKDDCMADPKIFNTPVIKGVYKNGRHWKMWDILSLQYAMDIKPDIRTGLDGTFILREPLLPNRDKIWRNFASIIPDFSIFCELMDELTDDYCSMYVHNATNVNDWRECVFWYKAKTIPDDFKFGCRDYWSFHYDRFNPDYVAPMY